MLSGMGWMHALRAKKGGGGGTDVTPDAIGWETYVEDVNPETSHKQIKGINTAINIFWQQVFNDGGAIQYSKNSGSFTTLAENTNLSVSNNDTIAWKFVGDNPGYAAEINVKNASDSNAALGTITFVEASGGGP